MGRRAHQRCRVEMLPWRRLFSREASALISRMGIRSSMSRRSLSGMVMCPLLMIYLEHRFIKIMMIFALSRMGFLQALRSYLHRRHQYASLMEIQIFSVYLYL